MKERLLIFAIVMSLVVILFLLFAESTQAPDEVEPGGALPGAPWSGKGPYGLTQAEAEAFTDFPLFWLGSEYGGFHLQAILHSQYEAPPGISERANNEVVFIYGSCRLHEGPGRQSCVVPLSVHVNSACYVLPEEAMVAAYRGPAQTLRGGALLLERGDAAMIWTGDSLIGIQYNAAVLPDGLAQALAALEGLGFNDVGPGEPLLPPDFARCKTSGLAPG